MEGDGGYRQESTPREYIRYSVIVWKMIVFVCAHTIQHRCRGPFHLLPLHGFWGVELRFLESQDKCLYLLSYRNVTALSSVSGRTLEGWQDGSEVS